MKLYCSCRHGSYQIKEIKLKTSERLNNGINIDEQVTSRSVVCRLQNELSAHFLKLLLSTETTIAVTNVRAITAQLAERNIIFFRRDEDWQPVST